MLAHIKDGKLIKIEGDPDHPWNHGRLCARVLAMTQYVEKLIEQRAFSLVSELTVSFS